MALTVIPTLATSEPTAPARSMTPATYIATFDSWLAARPAIRDEWNAAIAAMNLLAPELNALAEAADETAEAARIAALAALSVSTYLATSATSLSLTAGAKAVLLAESGRTFANGDAVTLIRRGDPATRMRGVASLVDMVARTMTVTVPADKIRGAGGPFTDWIVLHGALEPPPIATVAEIRAGAVEDALITPGAYQAALAEVTLTDAATIAVDLNSFINAVVTLGGNRILGNPTNATAGKTGRIRVVQDGTGSRTLSFGSNWKREGGAPTPSTAAGAQDFIDFEVVSPTYVRYAYARSPS